MRRVRRRRCPVRACRQKSRSSWNEGDAYHSGDGGAGFIGSHLCERLLDEGDRVICLDSMLTGRRLNLAPFERNPRFDLIECDVTDPMPPRLRADRVFHLACAASPPHYQADPVHTMMTCVLGTRNCLELARACGARFLLSSTSEVYGDPETHPQPEDYRGAVSTTGPRACYDEGKRAAEALVCDYRRSYGLDVRIARLFNTYGPRMRPDDGRASRAGESHPRALPEPYVSLSAHTAPDAQPFP